jgi:spore coat protein H
MVRRALFALLAVLTLTPVATVGRDGSPLPERAADFFLTSRVWTVELHFTKDQWTHMQPRHGAAGGGGAESLLGAEGSRNGVAARSGIEFEYVHADLAVDGNPFPDVGVRFKGNGSFLRARGTNKISLKVDLNKYRKGQKLAGLTTINLQNGITDSSWMNEVLSYQLYRDAGVPAPRSSFARVYVTVPGTFARQYFGLYTIAENVDTHFTQERFDTKAGAILKPSTRTPFTDMGAAWAAYNQTYDPKTDLIAAETARIIEFCQLVSRASDEEFFKRASDYVDLDEFARYLAVLAWIGNRDSLLQIGQNYYVYLHPVSRKFMFIPWDQDGSFGNLRNSQSESWAIDYPWSGVNPVLGRLYNVPGFRAAYLARVAEFNATIFRPERLAEALARVGPTLRPAVQEEGAGLLPAFDEVMAGRTGILPFARARVAHVATQLQK